MTVYKGYMKILKQNKGLILLYLVIFFSVTMMFQSVAKNDIQMCIRDSASGIRRNFITIQQALNPLPFFTRPHL